MSLATELSSHFDPKTRARGRTYFERGSVASITDVDDGVIATVVGSAPSPYEVYIKCSPDYSNVTELRCSCPRFADGYLCKHIWATLLELDLEDDEADILDEEDDEFDDLASDWEIARSAAAPSIAEGIGHRRRSSTSWRNDLRDVAVIQRLLEENGAGNALIAAAHKRNEVWYALNVGASTQRGRVAVDLFVRETKKSGKFGKFKRLSARREKLNEFTLPEDRQALGWLLGNKAEDVDRFGYAYEYSSYTPGVSRIEISPAMYEHLLPMLAATARFVWILERDAGVEDGRSVVWDDGPPWRFQLAVDEDAQAQCWRIRGELRRDDQARSLDNAVLLDEGGLVLWEDSLARLQHDASFAWAPPLRRTSAIEIPFTARDELLAQLWASGQSPARELPRSLQLDQELLVPQGRLQVQKEGRGYGYRAANDLFANVAFLYGEQAVAAHDTRRALVDAENNRVMPRDAAAEQQLLQQLADLSIRSSPRYEVDLGDVKFAKRRFSEVVSALVRNGWKVEADGKLIRSPGSVSISVNSGVDWFEVDGEIDFDGASVTLPELLKAAHKGESYVTLDDGSQGLLPEEWLEKYGGLIEMGQAEGESLRFRPTQAMLLDALLAAQENVQVDRGYRNFRKRLAKFDGVKPRATPRTFHGELRDYQKQGLGWLHFLRDFQFGGCLADDMGLGKTIQILALLESRRTRRVGKGQRRAPSLAVVPKSLVFNWIDEAARFTPNLRVLNYTGLGRKKKREQFGEHDLIVTTYGTLRRDIAKLKDTRFDYAILDEAQAIKNAGSQAAKACRLIHADHRLAMTGTPVENHLGELWSLFEFLNPGMLGNSTAANSLMKSAGKADPQSLELLRRALAPYVLRRTKKQVLSELPEKNEQTLHCEMDAKQRKQYDELREYYRTMLTSKIEEVGIKKAKIHVLEALLRLRQAACHPGLIDKKKAKQSSAKLDVLVQQLEEILDEGHKALVFSQFTSLLSIVRKTLDAKKIPYEYLDGRTRKRQDKVKRFQEDDGCRLFLISLKAGGHGLNLTAADYVYILDPWWNPAVEAQAVDRAHRIGQTRPVFAYRLICRDTVEEKIIELQKQKRELADAIISADSSLIRSLTADDLQLLLS